MYKENKKGRTNHLFNFSVYTEWKYDNLSS